MRGKVTCLPVGAATTGDENKSLPVSTFPLTVDESKKSHGRRRGAINKSPNGRFRLRSVNATPPTAQWRSTKRPSPLDCWVSSHVHSTSSRVRSAPYHPLLQRSDGVYFQQTFCGQMSGPALTNPARPRLVRSPTSPPPRVPFPTKPESGWSAVQSRFAVVPPRPEPLKRSHFAVFDRGPSDKEIDSKRNARRSESARR